MTEQLHPESTKCNDPNCFGCQFMVMVRKGGKASDMDDSAWSAYTYSHPERTQPNTAADVIMALHGLGLVDAIPGEQLNAWRPGSGPNACEGCGWAFDQHLYEESPATSTLCHWCASLRSAKTDDLNARYRAHKLRVNRYSAVVVIAFWLAVIGLIAFVGWV